MARQRRKGLIVTGIGVFLLGAVVAVAALVAGAMVAQRTVRGFARAAVGCTTTLRFEQADVFTVYVETKGRFGPLDGDCTANGRSFDRRDDDLPPLDVLLVDGAGATVGLAEPNGDHYSLDGFTGRAYAVVRIPAAGTYRVTPRSAATDIGVAIGHDPYGDAMVWWVVGLAFAAMIGSAGAVLVVLGLVGRRPRPEPAFGVGAHITGLAPAGTEPSSAMSAPPQAASWTSLPPPPPPPPGGHPTPDATRAGTTLPPPPPSTH